MSIVDLAVRLGKGLEGKYSSIIKNDDMQTEIVQDATTGVYTITTQDAQLIAALDQSIVEDDKYVTMVKPMTYGVVTPGVYTMPGHKMEELLEHRPMDYL